jgi:hypothetical protein
MQVFSASPAEEALAEIKDGLPAIEQETGVSLIISKWDPPAPDQHPHAQKVEVTDALAREFNLGAKQLKVISDPRKQNPIPIEEMKRYKDDETISGLKSGYSFNLRQRDASKVNWLTITLWMRMRIRCHAAAFCAV